MRRPAPGSQARGRAPSAVRGIEAALGIERLSGDREQLRRPGQEAASGRVVSPGPRQVGPGLGDRALPCRALPGRRRPLGLASQARASSSRPPSTQAIDAGTAIMTWQNMQANGSSSVPAASSTTASAASESGAAAISVP